ncbi:MAG TPA: molybdenum cofactor biosynthesis protein MoaE [Xanthobacteraceae bacterium]|nr:molybdenum cofactor biosynthesis protein MoaE [Xanthobacteraceae bacterium]
MATTTIRLQSEAFDVVAEVKRLTQGRTDIGAVVTFTGICRADENGERIAGLTLEHYPGMAEAEIARHVEAAYARWPLLGATVIHRFGRITPGEDIVMVAAASSHRQAAFAAAEFLMDYLKTRAPFWKQVDKAGGGTVEKTWIESKSSDDSAAERWGVSASRREAAK